MLVGYARVSKKEQDYEMQINELQKYGCERIFSEKISGASDSRKELNKAIEFLREGDTLVIWKLDRLGRSVPQLCSCIEILKQKKVNIISLTDNIDTSNMMGELFFHLSAVFAQLERNMIIERTKAGIQFAKEKGIKCGRPIKMNKDNIELIEELLKAGWTVNKISDRVNISKSSIYSYFPSNVICMLRGQNG
ncbi:recombinase family protein [Muribacter muris]|uniref:Recombinase family protein n=1 Tax=Muribacter muris TaxID=67855 RepID=A0A4Y9JT94_9PAST|nr:recombinase family protein [Muribacter muris]MBF0786018.1 recombinase family protein [Muribacter muris]MBF0826778.1 recombinase family protein [Muribacter muris]TFV08149.1 recombinase family protein [Muribacter muris]